MAASPHHDSRTAPLRIALVITELDVGGAERALVNLATGMDRARFEPRVYALGPRPRAEQSSLVDRLTDAGIPVDFAGATYALHVPRAVRRLWQAWSLWPPDVVQSFLFHADVIAALARGRFPATKHVLGFRVADPTRWRRQVRCRIARRADRVVCVSHAVARFARDRVHVANDKLTVIHNGIDMDTYANAPPLDWTELGLPSGRRIILCIARLHYQKGLDWLLNAMGALFESFPDVDLAIVGSGREEAALRAQANARSITNRVHFLGWRGDVPRLLAASRLLVLTSRWEGLPNSVLEAMATGLPVVAARTDGVVELLGDDPLQTFNTEDTRAFQQAVAHLLQHPARAAELGRMNQQRATAEFSLQRMVQSYEQLYRQLTNVTPTSNNHSPRKPEA